MALEEVRQRHGLAGGRAAPRAGTAGHAFGNRAELQVVFRNLLENAVRYSGGPSTCASARSASAASACASRSRIAGIGIERRELRRIFQRFYQASRDVQRQAQGLGLGLFVVRQLVRRQGGSVAGAERGPRPRQPLPVTLRTPPRSRAGRRGERAQRGAAEAPGPAEPRWR